MESKRQLFWKRTSSKSRLFLYNSSSYCYHSSSKNSILSWSFYKQVQMLKRVSLLIWTMLWIVDNIRVIKNSNKSLSLAIFSKTKKTFAINFEKRCRIQLKMHRTQINEKPPTSMTNLTHINNGMTTINIRLYISS